jgi:hypothetical protein
MAKRKKARVDGTKKARDSRAKDLEASKSQATAGAAGRRNLVVTTSMDVPR